MLSEHQKEKIVELLEELHPHCYDVLVFEDEREFQNFVDDGSLFVVRDGYCFCLDCDQYNYADKLANKLLPKAVKLIDSYLKK
ncbi:MAG: hypothetical protein PHG24_03105 [Candidatus Pacebacteria bacterium]|nr:hypothetical protein [Candidatus Paceibacterota bacterium]